MTESSCEAIQYISFLARSIVSSVGDTYFEAIAESGVISVVYILRPRYILFPGNLLGELLVGLSNR